MLSLALLGEPLVRCTPTPQVIAPVVLPEQHQYRYRCKYSYSRKYRYSYSRKYRYSYSRKYRYSYS